MKFRLLLATVVFTLVLSALAVRGRMIASRGSADGNASTSPLLVALDKPVPTEGASAVGEAMAVPVQVESQEGEVPTEVASADLPPSSAGAASDNPAPADAPTQTGNADLPAEPQAQDAGDPEIAVLPSPSVRHLEVHFDDIPCPGHIRAIFDAMELVKGVSDVAIYFDESRGEMDYDPALTTPEDIIRGMPRDCPATVISDSPKK